MWSWLRVGLLQSYFWQTWSVVNPYLWQRISFTCMFMLTKWLIECVPSRTDLLAVSSQDITDRIIWRINLWLKQQAAKSLSKISMRLKKNNNKIKFKSSHLEGIYTGNTSVINSTTDDKILYHKVLTSSHALFLMALLTKLQAPLRNFKTGTTFLLFTQLIQTFLLIYTNYSCRTSMWHLNNLW